MTMIHH
jgi:YD repeat-containing protein